MSDEDNQRYSRLETEKRRLEDLKRIDLLSRLEELQEEIKVEEFESLAASRMRQLVLSIKKKMGR